MKKAVYIFSFLFFMIVMGFPSWGQKTYNPYTDGKPNLYIEPVVENSTCYTGQPVTCVLTLFSETPDVAGVRPITRPALTKGEFATLDKISNPGNSYTKKIGNRIYHCFPLESFIFTVDKKGKYEFGGGEYIVSVNMPILVDHPIYGKVETVKTRNYKVEVRKCQINVKPMPAPPVNANVSGSIGDFRVDTVIPTGDIFLNESASALIVVKGNGIIDRNALPAYDSAFSGNVKLKSVSESRETKMENGQLVSELTLDCLFVPLSRENAMIGEVAFDFFNPFTGKYVTVKSKPVAVSVKSSVSKREKIEI